MTFTSDSEHAPRQSANAPPEVAGSDVFEYPRTISPAEIGEYMPCFAA